ncbi:MAG: SufD family Fe-S cluster assembly protein [Archaeoglobaceae archaeon]|nr:SufD family Fe-S cluster assembly protein [Archaeoglobaceae archaeon]MCX8152489.1 SufD family Fe-S cluster assembly protein [Archaeoglobaceae archaeon]MDW8013696.1 SufD family Fe-S cluster assembly protein [Archaeoglobaceae archaeon]
MSERDLASKEEIEKFREVGIELDLSKRSATFLQEDQFVKTYTSIFEGLEMMSVKDALKKYDWLKDYLWKVLRKDQDDYTKEVATSEDFNGYFIRALPGEKIDIPVEACLYLKRALKQKVHNIIIAEEGSELNIISGCTAHPSAVGMHIGVSEFFVKKNAKLTFTMIHGWNRKIEVRPRSAALVEEGGTFISNYVLLSPVMSVQMYPTAYVEKEGKAIFSSVIVALEGCKVDSGSRAVLRGEKASAEIISRTVSKGGEVIARGHIVGEAPAVKGHLECKGLILSEKGLIHAIPELEAKHPNVELSHEAAVGKIAEEEIFYLMTRGISRDEAISAIVRGFLEIEIKGLPEVLKQAIDQAISSVEKQLF